MRETKTFKIDGFDRQFTVRELTVEEIINLFRDEDVSTLTMDNVGSIFINKLLPVATDITQDELIKMAPSRLKMIWNKLREVNSDFFDFASRIGMLDLAAKLKEEFIKSFSSGLVGLLRQDTSTSGDTASHIS